MEKPTLSIIIICKNEERYIGGCIESALQAVEGMRDAELLLVDSLSTDKTLEIAQRYPLAIYQLRPQWRMTPAAGRYLGYLHSRGDYLLFVDGDSYLVPGFIEKALALFGKDPKLAALIGRRKEIYYAPDGGVVGEEGDINRIGEHAREIPTAVGSAMYARSAFQTAGSFNPFLYSYEEAELGDRLRQHGYRILGIPVDMVVHNTLPRENVATFFQRTKSNFHLGPGQVLRYRLRTGISRELLNAVSPGSAFLALAVFGLLALALSALLHSAWYIGTWLGVSLLLTAAFTLKSMSITKTLRYAVIWSVQAYSLVRGFLMKPHPADRYPTDARVVKAPAGAGAATLPGPLPLSTIAYINNHFPALSHTFIYHEVEGLRRRGMRIKTFSIRRPDLKALSEDSLELYRTTTYLLPPEIPSLLKAHLHYGVRYPAKYLKTLLFLMIRQYRHQVKDRIRTFFHFCEGVYLAELISKDPSIGHIHAHYASHPTTLALVASEFSGIPFSFTAHAQDIWDDRLFLKEKVDRASFVITCSEYGRQSIGRIYQDTDLDKITTIYHGVDVAEFLPPEAPRKAEKFYMLNIGRLCKEKAQDDLIRACKHLKDEGYDFRCDIVGDGPLLPYLRGLVEEYELQGTVTLPGKVFQENIKECYRKADVFVLSSVSENLPNVLLESLAMGLPVIATAIAGIPELIRDGSNGILVPPQDPRALAQALKAVMDDAALLAALSREGRNSVCRRFDATKCLDEISDLFSRSIAPVADNAAGAGFPAP